MSAIKNSVCNKIDLMHKLFGTVTKLTCKDCCHLTSYTANRKWYKCKCYGESSSEATDWRLKWTACGLIYVAKFCGDPIKNQVRLLNRKPKEESNITGQLVLDEFVEIDIPQNAWTNKPDKNCVCVRTKFIYE